MMVTKSSSAYWEGRAEAETLQRVYGISFPDLKQLKEWKHLQVSVVLLCVWGGSRLQLAQLTQCWRREHAFDYHCSRGDRSYCVYD